MIEDTKYTIGFRSMFREYDIRGQVSDDQLCPDNVYKIVRAYARYCRRRNIKKAVVGYDNRKCSPSFAEAAIKALRDGGVDVYYVGLTLTPVVYFAQYYLKSEGACMITASHNPDGWSGFKFANGYSRTLEPNDIIELYSLLDEKDNEDITPGLFTDIDVRDAYINEVVSRIHMGPKKLRVVLDAANGGAGVYIYEVFQRLGVMTFQLNCDPDDNYPKYFPNPSNIKARERLKEMVLHKYIHADLGMGFDGDGDRLGVIDNNGNNIWSDTILALLAKQQLEKSKGGRIVFDVKCSQTLIDVINQNGGEPIMWKTGHSYIKAKLHSSKAILAGERSGHIFIAGDSYYGFDDATFVAAKLIEYLSWQDKSLSEIIDSFPHYYTSPEIKTYCADDIKYKVVDELVSEFKRDYPGKVIDINGARVQFENSWGLVRASSNLPELVLIFEGNTKEDMLKIRSIFKTYTRKHNEISDNWENDIE